MKDESNQINYQNDLAKAAIKDQSNCRLSKRNNISKSKSQEVDSCELMKKINVMILVWQNNNIRYVNPKVKTTLGYVLEDFLDNENLSQKFKILHDQKIDLLSKNNDRYWLDCSIQPIQFAQQPATLITAINVTKYKTESELSEDVLPVESTSTHQAKLNCMISHELRSSLNVIAFSHKLLQRHCDRFNEQKKLECFERINRGIETMSQLIEDISIIGQASAQKLRMMPQTLNIGIFCQNLISDLHFATGETRVINFRNLKDWEEIIVDRHILRLILTNLLENALKYSSQNQVVNFTVNTTSENEVTFKIEDQGIGISLKDREQLFDPFYRGKNVEDIPGNGLGLAVVQKLVNAQGGSIWLDSHEGIGTTVMVSLPQNQIN